jgi:hypothetical protein
MQARGVVSFDTAAVTARAALAQGAIILDVLGGIAAPPAAVPVTYTDESGNLATSLQEPAPGSDAASTCSALVDAAAHALQSAAASSGGFVAKDITPSPLRIGDVVDLVSRIAASLNARAHAIAGGDPSPHPPTASVSESRALFTFSIARAKAQATAVGVDSGYRAGPGGAGGAAAAAGGAQRGGPAPAASAAAPGPRSAAAPAAPGGGAPAAASNAGAGRGGGHGHDASSVPLHHGHGAKSLKRSMSSRTGFVGALATGMPATAWIEGKAHPVTLRTDEQVTDLLLFPAGPAKKGVDTSQPLAVVPGGAYVSVRVGKPIKDGKSAKTGGLFSKGPKSEKTVCLDSASGNTLVQLELDTVALANELAAALEGLSTVAARLAS